MLARNFVMALAIAAVGLMLADTSDAGLLRGRRSRGCDSCNTCGTTPACNGCNVTPAAEPGAAPMTPAAPPAAAAADPAPPPAEASPSDQAAPAVAQPTTTTTYRNASTKTRRGLLGRFR